MSFFAAPKSLRLRDSWTSSLQPIGMQTVMASGNTHTSHPDFANLVLLVFEAVLEVVCVALPGYIVARQGMFSADSQRFLANLNVQLFTPALVFTKLASQLNAERFKDLAVIPVIFVVQTLVSWTCSLVVSKVLRFPKRQTNFVTAMAVFGNSNSLPISLVISLSKTLSGLHWDQIPGDNDNEVAARGILYLLIFQQLGQFLRWSWGYNVLLKPAEEYEESVADIEQGQVEGEEEEEEEHDRGQSKTFYSSDYESGDHTPHTVSATGSSSSLSAKNAQSSEAIVPPGNGNIVHRGSGNMAGHSASDHGDSKDQSGKPNVARFPSANHITRFPSYNSMNDGDSPDHAADKRSFRAKLGGAIKLPLQKVGLAISKSSSSAFASLPIGLQKVLRTLGSWIFRFFNAIWQSMNPPLWAMLLSVLVASVPALQRLFFTPGTFVNNSITHAIAQSGGVAVPLILVVLGANLARNTIPQEDLATSDEEKKDERKLLFAALVSRMLLPTIIMAPAIALFAKYVPVSILDDPIFIIVVFLLTGAPSALQLAQICQLNNVFMGVTSRLLFHSYVIWILPSTLILVMLALETVEWATAV